jgi:hypothetical protein
MDEWSTYPNRFANIQLLDFSHDFGITGIPFLLFF